MTICIVRRYVTDYRFNMAATKLEVKITKEWEEIKL